MKLNSTFALIAGRAEGTGAVKNGGASWTVPELMFESKGLIPSLQQLLIEQ